LYLIDYKFIHIVSNNQNEGLILISLFQSYYVMNFHKFELSNKI